jgi:hypothetical protein
MGLILSVPTQTTMYWRSPTAMDPISGRLRPPEPLIWSTCGPKRSARGMGGPVRLRGRCPEDGSGTGRGAVHGACTPNP